ncbi:MAG: ATPase [Bifidobacteriaceae bacterium]|jgi:sugar (pentulose or hexulose) kinase|nr:ATPase [Bifidobacteriaceae bacterium]
MGASARPANAYAWAGAAPAGEVIEAGLTALGIELGSTRVKAVLTGPDLAVLGTGVFDWENQMVDGLWSYSLDAVWQALRGAYRDLARDVAERHGRELRRVGAIGLSAMMHGYLAFGADDELLVPFRTWRNTNTERAAAALSARLGANIPLRWSVAHLYQAALEAEPHVGSVRFLTTLAGYVHWQLTGERVLGVGDASGMVLIGADADVERTALAACDELVAALPQARAYPWALSPDGPSAAGPGGRGPVGPGGPEAGAPVGAGGPGGRGIGGLLPKVYPAGVVAGRLTAAGAAALDPSGKLEPGAPVCPPEGDAGTGMVATGAVAPRTGNVSVGTSIFAMIVLERALGGAHAEIDLVTTPAGDPVAMVHCNNGASELGAWCGLFGEFARIQGQSVEDAAVFGALFREALRGEPDGGGLTAFNYLAGEPITGWAHGVPLFLRTPGSTFSLANFMRAQLFAVFATLRLGLDVLAGEQVAVDRLFAHGGVFQTEGVAQRLLAAALNSPVTVGETAGEGGAWGAAILAWYMLRGGERDLATYLAEDVLAAARTTTLAPNPVDVAGFQTYLARFSAALPAVRAAVAAERPAW